MLGARYKLGKKKVKFLAGGASGLSLTPITAILSQTVAIDIVENLKLL